MHWFFLMTLQVEVSAYNNLDIIYFQKSRFCKKYVHHIINRLKCFRVCISHWITHPPDSYAHTPGIIIINYLGKCVIFFLIRMFSYLRTKLALNPGQSSFGKHTSAALILLVNCSPYILGWKPNQSEIM